MTRSKYRYDPILSYAGSGQVPVWHFLILSRLRSSTSLILSYPMRAQVKYQSDLILSNAGSGQVPVWPYLILCGLRSSTGLTLSYPMRAQVKYQSDPILSYAGSGQVQVWPYPILWGLRSSTSLTLSYPMRAQFQLYWRSIRPMKGLFDLPQQLSLVWIVFILMNISWNHISTPRLWYTAILRN